ncbi:MULTISPECIES: cytochrome b [Nocardioides]|uniref:cytochrome b n=1 Tax=Nocardioides TaxID=1839 RepID=UPI00032FE3F6|nr:MULTISPECIES: cytochrome b/b6 domain-containing protein [Nocardioides]EON23849.1 cytochrome B561 [Nocardioides sp. CF8]
MLHNGPEGYGWLSKVLHWGTVLALVAQFVVGYAMDVDGGGRGRGRGRGGGSGRGRGRGGEEGYGVLDDRLLTLHVSLGVLIIVLALARLAWRRVDGLPPWSDRLGARQRTLATWTERCLMGLLLVIPATGLVLVLSSEDDLLWLHVAAHVAFFVVLAAHVALVVGKRLLPRMW